MTRRRRMDAGRKETTMRVPTTRASRRRSALVGILLVLGLALSGGLVAACGGGEADMPAMTSSITDAGAQPSMPADGSSAIEAAWAARPDYVTNGGARVMEAYRYALERPDVVQWMPCYCGCAAMEHRSNLDCFFRSRMATGAVAFEEHASYCDVCIDTALLAKRRSAEGRSLTQVRAEVDATWGGKGVPGTDTAYPEG
jgi:Protein of unknown function with PCYCGC motif